MDYHADFSEFCRTLEGGGAFLTVEDKNGKVNIMTIGWAQAGFIWGMPVMTVLVRPSRHTHLLLGRASYFSVCAPAAGTMTKELAFCGSKSGREYDKARACSLPLKAGVKKNIKYAGCPGLVYQCEVLGTTELAAGTLPEELRARYYAAGDVHTLYFGKILRADNFTK